MDNQHTLLRKDNLGKSAFTPLCKNIEALQQLIKEEKIQKEVKNEVEFLNQQQEMAEQREQNQIQQRKGKKKLVEWTSEQDKILFDRYIHNGPKWVQIAQLFPSKNDNDVKNRFYCCLRKVLKRINVLQKQYKLKPKKPLGLDSLLTVLQIGKWNKNTADKRFLEINKNIDSIIQVRNSVIELAVKPESEVDTEKLISIVEQLLDLKHCLKFINVKRVKKCVSKDPQSPFNVEQNPSNSEKEEQEGDSNEQKKKTEKSLNQQEDTSLDDQLYDIEKIQQNLRLKSKSSSMSLIESCRDILCPALVIKQQNEHMIFLF